MGADYNQLVDFSEKLKMLNDKQREELIIASIKEIASRVLAKVIKRTTVGVYGKEVSFTTKDEKQVKFTTNSKKTGGTLRRGWTASKALNVSKKGNNYVIDIINPVEYASYVEYGHRTRNHTGWVEGQFMLTISMQEVESMTPKILERRLKAMLKDVIS